MVHGRYDADWRWCCCCSTPSSSCTAHRSCFALQHHELLPCVGSCCRCWPRGPLGPLLPPLPPPFPPPRRPLRSARGGSVSSGPVHTQSATHSWLDSHKTWFLGQRVAHSCGVLELSTQQLYCSACSCPWPVAVQAAAVYCPSLMPLMQVPSSHPPYGSACPVSCSICSRSCCSTRIWPSFWRLSLCHRMPGGLDSPAAAAPVWMTCSSEGTDGEAAVAVRNVHGVQVGRGWIRHLLQLPCLTSSQTSWASLYYQVTRAPRVSWG
jgi:hypothetical protein